MSRHKIKRALSRMSLNKVLNIREQLNTESNIAKLQLFEFYTRQLYKICLRQFFPSIKLSLQKNSQISKFILSYFYLLLLLQTTHILILLKLSNIQYLT